MKQANKLYRTRRSFVIVALAGVFSMFASQALAQKLTWLTAPPDSVRCTPSALSANGSIVVGDALVGRTTRAIRWDATGFVELGSLAEGLYASPKAISSDGSVVVGSAVSPYGYQHAFRWENGIMTDLGTLGGTHSYGVAVTGDGRTVYGYGPDPVYGAYQIICWSDNTLSDMGPGTVKAVSRDGSTVVAVNDSMMGFLRQGGQSIDLGGIGITSSTPNAVSADGSVVVGNFYGNDWGPHAFRWQGGVMADLGTLGGDSSNAFSVSADGSVIVGDADLPWPLGTTSFMWTAKDGMQDLNFLVASQLQEFSYLNSAKAVSANGMVIVGYGYNAATDRMEAWKIDMSAMNTPPTATVCGAQTLEATGPSTLATLSGSATDPEDEGYLTYSWSEGVTELGTGTSLSVGLTVGSHAITLTVTDPQGAQGRATTQVTIEDTTPPALANVPVDMVVEAVNANGAAATFGSDAVATDLVDGRVPVKFTPSSGSVFAPGRTQVTMSAVDAKGNTSESKFKLWVQYSWSGFLSPTNPPGKKTGFKLGSTIQVKFRLTGASSNVSDARATFSVRRIVGDTPSGATVASGSFHFDLAAGQYVSKWSTKGLTEGTYQISVDLGDGVSRTTTVVLT